MNHKIISVVVALAVGLSAAWYVYDRATDPLPALQRMQEMEVVSTARTILKSYVAPSSDMEFVDSIGPDRKVGKVYIAPIDNGWEISGYYRRGAGDPWHPWLMSVDSSMHLQKLSLQDDNPQLIALSSKDPKFDAVP